MSSPSAGTPPAAEPGHTAGPSLLDRGDIVNLMGRFRRRLKEDGRKLTVAQNRLIMKRIEAAGVLGKDVVRAGQQIGRIAEIVAEVVPMGEGRIEEELRACRR